MRRSKKNTGEEAKEERGESLPRPTKERGRPLEVVRVALDSLKLDPRNAREHPKRNLESIQNSLRRFGQQKPIVVSLDGTVRAGNGTVLAAKALGWKDIDVVRTDLSGPELEAYAVADNRSAETAGWNEENLGAILKSLREQDLSLALDAGFNEAEVERIVQESLGGAGEGPSPQLELAEELAKKWGTARGQEWRFGSKESPGKEHILIVGDSTKPEEVAFTLRRFEPKIMITDPPYGVEYDPAWRENVKNSMKTRGGKHVRAVVVANDDRVDWTAAWKLFPGEIAYVWHDSNSGVVVGSALAALEFEIRNLIIWKKKGFTISRGHYHWAHEACWYSVRKGGQAHWCGDRSQTTVWEIDSFTTAKLDGERIEGADLHSTQKPVETFARPMRNHGERGWCVYDPFAGSGTCFVAAEKTGRVCLGVEISNQFAAVILERVSQMGMEPRIVSGADKVERN